MSTQDITVDFFSYYFWLSIALYIGLFWVLKSIAYRPFMSKEDRDSPEVHLIDKIMIGIIALSSITLLILYLFFYHPDKERIMRIYGTSEEKKSRSSPIEKREDVDDNTISVDDFQKGKVWLRNYLQVGLESLTTMRDTKYLTNKLQFTVINGFEKEKSNSQNIVIEVENLSLPKADNIRVILNPEGIFQFCQTKDSGIWKKIEPKKQIVQKHTRRIDMVTVWDDTFYYVFLPLPIKWGNNSTTAETSDGRKAEIKTKIENGVLKAVCTIYENAADTEDSEKPPKDETIKSKVYDKIELPFKKDEPWATSLTRQRLSRWKITTDSTD